jgi:hypothetical protein
MVNIASLILFYGVSAWVDQPDENPHGSAAFGRVTKRLPWPNTMMTFPLVERSCMAGIPAPGQLGPIRSLKIRDFGTISR